MTDLLNYWSFF